MSADVATAPAAATVGGGSDSSSNGVLRRACPLCGKPGTKVCSGCSKVGYCSKEHQRDHWKEHKQVCAQKHKLLNGTSSSASASASSSTSLSSSSSSSGAKEEIVVTWQDQQSINAFSRLNTRMSALDDQVKQLAREHAGVVDAADGIEMLLDEDSVMVKVGEVYVRVSNEEGEEWVKKEKQAVEERKGRMEAERADIDRQMKELKATLYAKFGKAINLENAEQTINDD